MRHALRAAVAAISIAAAAPAIAAPTVDGTVSSGEYGAATATVATDEAAPVGNFGSPTGSARAGYTIQLTSANDTLFGAIVQTGGTAADDFANLYFDLDPLTHSGSDFGVEVTNLRGFVPGQAGYFDLSPYINFCSTTLGGLITLEFSIANSAFRTYIAQAQALGLGFGDYTPQDARLNLSQSLSYSVAGGQPTYGDARLGTFSITAAVPEPATWGMMIVGFGAVGFAMRRGRKAKVRVAYA